ncbi:uncharacterized protein GGS22DRAFT_175883 [Annulohypoxylon maeteangense]|uniref:uncharacterized protein n=1 Tax=Annulohypoxylon maeteangense TaxID=1927788 RepID=UPI00200840E3|nr:uncharacterized protein GGS22DRAFT_175883 [Annulohypoxylon maeteangense]KAI0880100.1 hypothetical protein GGS22DRAFT_175883 [Annulohypoxylon maeteangense]
MASSPLEDDDPPPYVVGNRNDAGEILQPAILVLTGHFIRAQTVDGTPLYELSRDIQASSTTEAQLAQVSLERLIHNVRVSANGTPRVLHRTRHIFELKHLPPVISTGFPYCLDAASRHALGNLALKCPSFPRSTFKVVRINEETGDGLPKGYKARKESLKEGETIFEIHKKRGHYEWMSPEGSRIAVEDETEDHHRLIVTAPVMRKMMDAMIGSWCLRIWRDSMKSNHQPRGALKTQVRSAREILPTWW